MTGILIAVLAIAALAAIFGVLLGFASIRFKVEADPIVDQIDAILPQTQCGQCGYPVVVLMQKRLPMATLSTSARLAASQPLKS